MKKNKLLIALLCTAHFLAAQSVSSTFDNNADGWTIVDNQTGPASITYNTTGGNPSGHISGDDGFGLGQSTLYFVAPSRFLNGRGWNYGNNLSFDLRSTGLLSTFFSESDVILEGSGLTLVFDLPNPTSTWTRFTCPLNENAGWRVGRNGPLATLAELQAVLCRPTRLWIRCEYRTGPDEGYLDNVSLGATACAPSVSNLTYTICSGQSVIVNGKTYATAGVFRDTIQRCYPQCDSIITVALTLSPPLSIAQNLRICQGQSVRVGTKTYAQTGIYRDTLKTVGGCDSIIVTDLTVNPTAVRTQNLTICQGDRIVIGTRTYTTAGVYVDTLKTSLGCDSVVTTNLTVVAPVSRTQNVTICQGNTVTVGSKTYVLTGVYRDTLKTLRGCDSIVVTNLMVNPTASSAQNVTICQGNAVTVGAKRYTVSGNYRDTLKTANGCDSIVSTNLTVLAAPTTTADRTVCARKSVQVGTKNYSTAGTYRDTLKTTSGCDSIVITNLTVTPLSKTVIDTLICAGKTVVFNGKTYEKEGIYRDTIRQTTACDSILEINLTIQPLATETQNFTLCNGDSILLFGRVYRNTGTYTDTIRTANSCGKVLTINILASNLSVNAGADLVIEKGDSVRLNPSVSGVTGALLKWTPNFALSCNTCVSPVARPTRTTVYTLEATDTATRCSVRDDVTVEVKACGRIFIPTTFSPNGDGSNDYFTVFAADCVRRVKKMSIQNRWGSLLFFKADFLPNDEVNGWNGTFNNRALPPDVYIYVIELELGDGSIDMISGDVTLVK